MTESQEQGLEGAGIHVNILLPPSWLERTHLDLVDRIVRALYEHPQTRAAIEAAGGGTATGEPRYVSLSELQRGAPPPGVPFLNAAIGVITVPSPRGGVQAVEAAIKEVAPPGTKVEQAVVGGIPN